MSAEHPVSAIILAAGQGTRMKSTQAKVLHPLCGAAMVDFVVRAALDAGAHDAVVVVGHQGATVEQHLRDRFGERVRIAVQEQQNGTGHAVQCGLPALRTEADTALLLYADTPLLPAETLRQLLEAHAKGGQALAMLSCTVDDPTGYGRLLRNDAGTISQVREHRDASDTERAICEINPGVYAAKVEFLRTALGQLKPNNAQGELYLTDIVAMAAAQGSVTDCEADARDLAGINDRAQLAQAQATMYERIADALRLQGVTISIGAQIDAQVVIEPDAIIESGVALRGQTRVGRGARIDVGCVLDNVEIAAGAYLKPYSVCTDARIGPDAQIGPFSHLRPGSDIDREARVGNFVEMKKTRLGPGAKANHLAYLGDGEVGAGANIGAGTIFCNYDGFQKHRTVIGANAFIGSDSQIIAPVTVGEGSYVATGTTVTRDIPDDTLAIARTRQENKEGYASRLRRRLEMAAKKNKSAPKD